MADLKELLGKYLEADKLDGAIEELNQELPKQYIPKGRFNEVNEELKTTKNALEEIKKSYTGLETKVSTVDELQKQIEDFKKQNQDIESKYQSELSTVIKRTQLKDAFSEKGVHKQALDLLVDKYLGEAQLEESKLVNIDSLIDKIKAERGELFVTKTETTPPSPKGKETDTEQERLKRLFGL